MKICAVALIGAVLLLSGCKKGPSWKSATYDEITLKPATEDVQIPAGLWDKIRELNAVVHKQAAEKNGQKNSEAPETPEMNLESLKVYLVERNKGVLKGVNLALSLPQGGGELNLSDYVQPLRGSFYVAFEFLPSVENADTKVYFVSNSVIRKLGEDQVGSGCNTFFDESKKFADEMKHDGLLVNTSDQRHVSALAGIYVFVSTYDQKLHISTLTIKDDQYRALQCRH